MADPRLRELERRFRATGAVADEVEWLRERLRAGAAAPARLELAAWLGHAAACALVDLEPPATTRALLEALGQRDPGELLRRVGLALLRRTAWRQVERAARTLALLEADLTCRCRDHEGQLASLPNPPYPRDERGRATARAARYAALAALHPADAPDALEQVARSVAALGLDPIATLRSDLVPWLLDLS